MSWWPFCQQITWEFHSAVHNVHNIAQDGSVVEFYVHEGGLDWDSMYTLLHGLYKYFVQKDEFCVLILGLDNAGKTVSSTSVLSFVCT